MPLEHLKHPYDTWDPYAMSEHHLYLFVYGTLKRGYGNNRHFLGDAEFVCPARTVSPYVLCNVGFPVAFKPERLSMVTCLPIIGELFRVQWEHIHHCDRLEGHPDMYRREIIQVETNDPSVSPINSYMYIGNGFHTDESWLKLVCPHTEEGYYWGDITHV